MKVLYFSTPTCGPCRSFYPILSEYLSKKEVIMEKIDVSETDNFHYKDKYQLTSVPTIVVLNEEDIIGKVVGVDFGKVKELV